MSWTLQIPLGGVDWKLTFVFMGGGVTRKKGKGKQNRGAGEAGTERAKGTREKGRRMTDDGRRERGSDE